MAQQRTIAGAPSGNAPPAETASSGISSRNLLQIFYDGGWMMYPIALCSFVLTVFAFERWISLRWVESFLVHSFED